jgi:hypothetical protein
MPVTNHIHEPRTWTDSFAKRPRRRNMDMKLGTRNVRCLYRAGSLVTVSKELSRFVNNIKMDHGEIGWGGVDWIGLAQDRDKWRAHVSAVMNLRVPSNAGKLSSGYTTGGLSSSAQFHRVSSLVSSLVSWLVGWLVGLLVGLVNRSVGRSVSQLWLTRNFLVESLWRTGCPPLKRKYWSRPSF